MDLAHTVQRKSEKLFYQASASNCTSLASVMDDADVQFISCAPRRRRKEIKRFASFNGLERHLLTNLQGLHSCNLDQIPAAIPKLHTTEQRLQKRQRPTTCFDAGLRAWANTWSHAILERVKESCFSTKRVSSYRIRCRYLFSRFSAPTAHLRARKCYITDPSAALDQLDTRVTDSENDSWLETCTLWRDPKTKLLSWRRFCRIETRIILLQ